MAFSNYSGRVEQLWQNLSTGYFLYRPGSRVLGKALYREMSHQTPKPLYKATFIVGVWGRFSEAAGGPHCAGEGSHALRARWNPGSAGAGHWGSQQCCKGTTLLLQCLSSALCWRSFRSIITEQAKGEFGTNRHTLTQCPLVSDWSLKSYSC